MHVGDEALGPPVPARITEMRITRQHVLVDDTVMFTIDTVTTGNIIGECQWGADIDDS